MTIDGGSVTTFGPWANAVYARHGTVVSVADATIEALGPGANGLKTGGGAIVARNLTMTTGGEDGHPFATGPGDGGTITVTGGTYESNGSGMAAIDGASTVTVTGADLKTNAPETAAVTIYRSTTANAKGSTMN